MKALMFHTSYRRFLFIIAFVLIFHRKKKKAENGRKIKNPIAIRYADKYTTLKLKQKKI